MEDVKPQMEIASRAALRDGLRSLAVQLRELVASRVQTQTGLG
jgi:hypothetical protein